MMENEVQIQQVAASPEDNDKTSSPQKEKNPKRQAAARQAAQTRKANRDNKM